MHLERSNGRRAAAALRPPWMPVPPIVPAEAEAEASGERLALSESVSRELGLDPARFRVSAERLFIVPRALAEEPGV